MFKIILLIVIVALLAVLGLAATRPDVSGVERSASIKATPEKIFPLIADFHQWGAWSPWEKMDPAMKRTFSGATSGKGAVYAWEGNSKVGAGRMEITDTVPSKITIQLDFIKPFEGHNIAEFTLTANGETTNVTWAMHGPAPFISKLMCLIFNMDKLIGKDFEAGLANLKNVVEK